MWKPEQLEKGGKMISCAKLSFSPHIGSGKTVAGIQFKKNRWVGKVLASPFMATQAALLFRFWF
jgi:hypothetical protein